MCTSFGLLINAWVSFFLVNSYRVLVLCAVAVGEWLGVNEFTLILSAFMLAFGTYLVSIILPLVL